MSLILDALRKMEQERQAKRRTSKEVRTEVLNYRGAVPATEKTGLTAVVAAILVISIAAACFFLFTREESVKSQPVKNAEPLKQETQPAIASQPLPPPPTTKSTPVGVKAPAEHPKPALNTEKAVRKAGNEEFTVSGIAWQEERSLRRAVINGALVGEGAEILGAKIVEIKENRIRFSRGNELFEVAHSAGSGR